MEAVEAAKLLRNIIIVQRIWMSLRIDRLKGVFFCEFGRRVDSWRWEGSSIYFLAGGWSAKYFRAFSMSSGIGGGWGRWSPVGWNPFSSAMYVRAMFSPSGDVYEKAPLASCWCKKSWLDKRFSVYNLTMSTYDGFLLWSGILQATRFLGLDSLRRLVGILIWVWVDDWIETDDRV